MIKRWEIRENTLTDNSVYILLIEGTDDSARNISVGLSSFCRIIDAKVPPFSHVFELYNITDDSMLEKIRIKIEEISQHIAIEGDINERTKHVNLDVISPETEILGRNVDLDEAEAASLEAAEFENQSEADQVFQVKPEFEPVAEPIEPARVVPATPKPAANVVRPQIPAGRPMPKPAFQQPKAAVVQAKPVFQQPKPAFEQVKPAFNQSKPIAPKPAQRPIQKPSAAPSRPAMRPAAPIPAKTETAESKTDIFAVKTKAPETKVSAADIFSTERSNDGKVHLSDGDFSIKQDFASLESLDIELDGHCDVGDGTFINLSSAEGTQIKNLDTNEESMSNARPVTSTKTGTMGIATLIGGEYPEETVKTQRAQSLKLMGALANDPYAKQPTLIEDPYKKKPVSPEQPQRQAVNKFMPAIEETAPSVPAKPYSPEPAAKPEPENHNKAGGFFGKFFSKFASKAAEHLKKHEEPKPLNFQEQQPEPVQTVVQEEEQAAPQEAAQPVAAAEAVKPAPVKEAANPFARLGSVRQEEPAPAPKQVISKPKLAARTVGHFSSIASDNAPLPMKEDNPADIDKELSAKIQVDDIFAAETICEFYADPEETGNENKVNDILQSSPATTAKTKTGNTTVNTANMASINKKPLGGVDDFFDVPNLLSSAPEPEPIAPQPQGADAIGEAVEAESVQYNPSAEIAEAEPLQAEQSSGESITSKLAASKPAPDLTRNITKTETPFIFTSHGEAKTPEVQKPSAPKPFAAAKPAFNQANVKPSTPRPSVMPPAPKPVAKPVAAVAEVVAQPSVSAPVQEEAVKEAAPKTPKVIMSSKPKHRKPTETVVLEEPENEPISGIIDLKKGAVEQVEEVKPQALDISAVFEDAAEEAAEIETNITELDDNLIDVMPGLNANSGMSEEVVEPIEQAAEEVYQEEANIEPAAEEYKPETVIAAEPSKPLPQAPLGPKVMPKAPPAPVRLGPPGVRPAPGVQPAPVQPVPPGVRHAPVRPVPPGVEGNRKQDLNKEDKKILGEKEAYMTQDFKDNENLENAVAPAPRNPAAPRTPAAPVPPVVRTPSAPRPAVSNPAANPLNRPANPAQVVLRPVQAANPARPTQAVRPGPQGVQRPAVARGATAVDHTILVSAGQIYKKNNWPLEIPLNPLFTFDNMDMASNRFAHATAMSVIDNIGTMHNPFMVYGDGGTGKTHFLNAMGYELSMKIGQEKIFFTNGVRFSRGVQRYVEEGNIAHLEEFFSAVEVLIIDDIHLTAVNEHNRDFISRILNRFLQEKKQILISSKYPPESLARFEELVRFRLDQGWVSELKQPRQQHFAKIYNRMIEDAELGLNEVQTQTFLGLDKANLGSISRNIKRAKVLNRRINDSGLIQMTYDQIMSEMLATNGENQNSEILRKDFADIINISRSENVDWGSFGFFYPADQADKFKWIAYCIMQKAKELGIKGGFNFALKSSYSTDHIISAAFKIANICDNKNLKGAIILGPALTVCQESIRDNFYDILTHMLEVMMIRCGIVDAESIKNPSAYVRVLGDILK